MTANQTRPILRLLATRRFSDESGGWRYAEAGDLYCHSLASGGRAALETLLLRLEHEVEAIWAAADRPIGKPFFTVSTASSLRIGGGQEWRFCLPAERGLDESNLPEFFHELAASAGARAHTLAALDFEATDAHFRFRLDSVGVTYDYTHTHRILDGLSALQSFWAARIDRYLALDVAAGTTRHPELVRELNTGLGALPFALARHLLLEASSVRGKVLALNSYTGKPAFRRVLPAEMIPASVALEAGGWIEATDYDPNTQILSAARGPKLRQLSSKDALNV